MTRLRTGSVFHRLGTALAAMALLGQVLAFASHQPALAASTPAHLLLDPAAWCGTGPASDAPQTRDDGHCTLCPVFTGPVLPPPQAVLAASPPVSGLIAAQSKAAPAPVQLSPQQARAPPVAL